MLAAHSITTPKQARQPIFPISKTSQETLGVSIESANIDFKFLLLKVDQRKNRSNQIFAIDGYQICVISDLNEKKEELGTGFVFLRPDWVVTAAHVVIEYGIPRKNLYGQFPTNNPNKLDLEVIATHRECDIALLRILNNPNPCKRPLYPGYDDLSVSNGLVCCGYTPSRGKTITMSLVKTYGKEIRERINTETILEFENDGIEGGSSGGPIFGDGGVVLGLLINQFSLEEEPHKKFARATSIHNLMNAISIDFEINQFIKYHLNED